MTHQIIYLLAFAVSVSTGCTASTDSTDRSDVPERGAASSGKADQGGSCQGHCGEKSASSCWCDSKCEGYGDCCEDNAAVCGSSCEATCAARGDQTHCFPADECTAYCTAVSSFWSDKELDAFETCVRESAICYGTIEDCMHSRLCMSACDARGQTTCFGRDTCLSFCSENLAGWSSAEYDAFVTCTATDPLCFQTIESCMDVP